MEKKQGKGKISCNTNWCNCLIAAPVSLSREIALLLTAVLGVRTSQVCFFIIV